MGYGTTMANGPNRPQISGYQVSYQETTEENIDYWQYVDDLACRFKKCLSRSKGIKPGKNRTVSTAPG